MASQLSDEIARRANANATAARSVFEAAGLAVEWADGTEWRVAGHRFWPSTGLWQRPDGTYGGGGARELAAEVRSRAAGNPSTTASGSG